MNWCYLVIAHHRAVINRALSSSGGERENQECFCPKKRLGFFYHEIEEKLSLYAGGGILSSAWPRSDEFETSILS